MHIHSLMIKPSSFKVACIGIDFFDEKVIVSPTEKS